MTASAQDMRPVFVIGMNGSGTTMLADSLGHHPGLYMFPYESKIIPLYLRRPLRAGALDQPAARRQLAEKIIAALPLWRDPAKVPVNLPDEALAACRTTAEVFDAIFRHMAGRVGKSAWMEKSPVNTEYVALLAHHFPAARFVHIIRDGRDAAQSFHRRWLFDPVHTVWRWKHVVRLGCEQGQALGPAHYMQLHYEDLTADPETQMRRVCAFLDLPFTSAVLSSSMRYVELPEAQSGAGRIIANSDKWQRYFPEAVQRRLEEVAGQQLVNLGYGATVLGDRELGPAEVRYLRGKDIVMRSLAFFKYRGLAGLPRYFQIVRSAMRARAARRF